MKIELNGQQLQPGDIVVCQGIKCVVKEIAFQEPYSWRDSYYTEFRDTDGVYRSWKQQYDGGHAYRECDVIGDYFFKKEV